MPRYQANVKDMQFVLHEMLQISTADTPGYQDLEPDFTEAILDAVARVATETLTPLNISGDRQGCCLDGGAVHTPDGFKPAFKALRAGGWTSLCCAREDGGEGLPFLMYTAVGEILSAANMALNMYAGLTHGAYSAIARHGSPDQRRMWLPKLASCEWTGTMNLTEPQCGTDLGLISTCAVPQADGSYRLRGQKIFISAGDHDLAENIVHLVLARTPDAPSGTKGLSLFIVPKFLPDAQGRPGIANGVHTRGIEDKMGIHASPTCALDYDQAQGWLMGPLHGGMAAMFTMMNEARLGVGLQGYALAGAAYENALEYARTRRQGRAPSGPFDPEADADPLIVHPDVRRMLMEQKSFVEGARALAFWGASLIDRAEAGDAPSDALASLLTPVIKGVLTDRGFDSTVLAQQVFGGYGYIEDTGMAQFVRDARITMIYEGANGVQALDLVGRKLGAQKGEGLRLLLAEIEAECARARDLAELAPLADALAQGTAEMMQATAYLAQTAKAHPDQALAGSYDFMHLTGHVCLGLMWLRMACAAQRSTWTDQGFLQAKLHTARYYLTRHMPACAMHRMRIETGGDSVMALPADAF